MPRSVRVEAGADSLQLSNLHLVTALLREHLLTDTQPGSAMWSDWRVRALHLIARNVVFNRGSNGPLWREDYA